MNVLWRLLSVGTLLLSAGMLPFSIITVRREQRVRSVWSDQAVLAEGGEARGGAPRRNGIAAQRRPIVRRCRRRR